MRIEKRFRHTLLALALASPVTFATQLQPLPASAPSARSIGVIDQVFAFHDAMAFYNYRRLHSSLGISVPCNTSNAGTRYSAKKLRKQGAKNSTKQGQHHGKLTSQCWKPTARRRTSTSASTKHRSGSSELVDPCSFDLQHRIF